ncbi:MAG: hypothetical protein RLZZ436_2195 [Planctomycetota bacterium]
MKRHRGLYSSVCSFENLLAASLSARRRKRSRRDVEEFEFDLERNLHELSTELRERTYQSSALPGLFTRGLPPCGSYGAALRLMGGHRVARVDPVIRVAGGPGCTSLLFSLPCTALQWLRGCIEQEGQGNVGRAGAACGV